MQLRLLDVQRNAEYIGACKHSVEQTLGIKPASALAGPRDFCLYLALYRHDCAQPIGLVEAFFLDQVFADYAQSPLSWIATDTARNAFNATAFVHTMHVAPEFRLSTPAYAYLYLGIALLLRRLGAVLGMAATLATNSDLLCLYQKTGGHIVGGHPLPEHPDKMNAILAFNTNLILRHPLIRRVSQALQIEPADAIATRRRNGRMTDALPQFECLAD